jgi:hypothetical protein
MYRVVEIFAETQFRVVTLDPPAQLGQTDEIASPGHLWAAWRTSIRLAPPRRPAIRSDTIPRVWDWCGCSRDAPAARARQQSEKPAGYWCTRAR